MGREGKEVSEIFLRDSDLLCDLFPRRPSVSKKNIPQNSSTNRWRRPTSSQTLLSRKFRLGAQAAGLQVLRQASGLRSQKSIPGFRFRFSVLFAPRFPILASRSFFGVRVQRLVLPPRSSEICNR